MMTPAGSFFPHPEGMSEAAAELWRHIVDAHPRGYFQAGDVPLLRAYCEEYARRNRAERMLAEQGEVIETASGAVKDSFGSRRQVKSVGLMPARRRVAFKQSTSASMEKLPL